MGSRGPVPKRSAERAGHRTKAERPDVVRVAEPAKAPPARRGWAPAAKAWYRALARSGQSRYFEPSDWELARLVADLLSRQLRAERPSAEMVKACLAAMASLGTTEADRRRMRIEVERPVAGAADEAEQAAVAVLEEFRRRHEWGHVLHAWVNGRSNVALFPVVWRSGLGLLGDTLSFLQRRAWHRLVSGYSETHAREMVAEIIGGVLSGRRGPVFDEWRAFIELLEEGRTYQDYRWIASLSSSERDDWRARLMPILRRMGLDDLV